jgi:glycosyltransferase involved in cell wall biosynthesis
MRLRPNPFKLSVVVPCYNEGSHLQEFITALKAAITPITNNYEILLINDGSKDNTHDIASSLVKEGNIRYLEFSRNFGKEAALMAGIDHANGDATLLIDADFQHPLEKLPEMAELWKSGYEMIYGVIANRQGESISKRLGTSLLYKLLNTSDIAIPENAGDFRWLDQKVVNALRDLPERNRFMKGLYAWVGFKSIAIPFEVKNRHSGQSTFNMGRLIKLGMAGLTSFSAAPLQLWIGIGALISFLALVYGAYVIVDTVVYGNAVSGWPTLTVALMLFSGIQLLSIGILGEYIGRIFTEVKQRPLYVIAEDLGEPK